MASRTNARALQFLANSNGKSSIIRYLCLVTYVHIRIELRDRYVYNSVRALCLVFVVIISIICIYKQTHKHYR